MNPLYNSSPPGRDQHVNNELQAEDVMSAAPEIISDTACAGMRRCSSLGRAANTSSTRDGRAESRKKREDLPYCPGNMEKLSKFKKLKI